MSEQEAESTGSEPGGASSEEGLGGLQEANLDSVQGGGNVPQPLMDLQDSEPDTVKKSEDLSQYETRDESWRDPNRGD